MRGGPPEVRRRKDADYMRIYREGNAIRQGYDAAQRNAYYAAARRLREAHSDEFNRYYAEEKAQRGVG